MDHLGPSLHHFPHDSSHWDGNFPRETLRALQTDSNPHTFTIAPQVHTATPILPKTNETKPRLGLDEVDILEREFKTNPKPTTQTKRKFADDMGVDLARINNWFQNRRAKRRQEKKQKANEKDCNRDTSKIGVVPSGLAEVDERHDAGHTTQVEGVKIKVEIECHSGPGLQEEVTSEDSSCASDTAELFSGSYMNSSDAIPMSTIDRPKDVQDDHILPILDSMRQALVERIMDEFWIVFSQDWTTGITQHSRGSPTSVNSKDRDTSAEKESFSSSLQKRQRSDKEDSPDESGNKKPRRQGGHGPRPSGGLADLARFACPFRKYDPQKYSIHSHRVCALTSWTIIARVKEHLYRIHKAAPYCKRCWKVFESEELLDSHATVPASSICEAMPGHPPEGVTPKQVAELKSKAKPYSKQNEADRWKEIFRLLFPGATVPSPYWEQIQDHAPLSPNSQVLASYEAYLHRELPRLFRSRVEDVVLREMQPVEANLLANLERLIRECQDQLSSGYRETQVTAHQSEAIPTPPAGYVENPVDPINTNEHLSMAPLELDQQPSSDFFDAVLQPPPPQEDDHVLGFSTSDAGQFGNQNYTQSSSLSDSGYVSVPRCSCDGICRCPNSRNGFDNRDVDVRDPSISDPAQDLEVQADDVLWRNWLENRD